MALAGYWAMTSYLGHGGSIGVVTCTEILLAMCWFSTSSELFALLRPHYLTYETEKKYSVYLNGFVHLFIHSPQNFFFEYGSCTTGHHLM